MTEMMNVNPLMDFARKTECSVKIPSQGLWYDDDAIEFNAIGEVDIMPMLPNDEMKIVNPESLISGDAIISVIKSCCPGIKRPEELYYPDVNVLLLGIKKATYGDELIQTSICPNCWNKKNDIEHNEFLRLVEEAKKNIDELSSDEYKELVEEAKKNVASKITEMEKKNEIIIREQSYKYSIDSILNEMKFLPKDGVVETKEGLKIYVTPYRCIDKIKFTTRNIQQQKIYDYYRKVSKENKEDINEQLKVVNNMSNLYDKLTNQSIDIIASSIRKIVLPTGETVDDGKFINEYVRNVSSDLVTKLNNKIMELNSCGIHEELSYKCECCGHEWKEKFYGFNQSDFFGTGS